MEATVFRLLLCNFPQHYILNPPTPSAQYTIEKDLINNQSDVNRLTGKQ